MAARDRVKLAIDQLEEQFHVFDEKANDDTLDSYEAALNRGKAMGFQEAAHFVKSALHDIDVKSLQWSAVERGAGRYAPRGPYPCPRRASQPVLSASPRRSREIEHDHGRRSHYRRARGAAQARRNTRGCGWRLRGLLGDR